MVSFNLTEFETALLEEAHVQALLARTHHARYYDTHEDDCPPPEFPQAADRPDVFNVAREHPDRISGASLIECLLFIEQFRGDVVPLRFPPISLGNHIVEAVGTSDQKDRYANSVVAIAMTEPGAGSDPTQMRTSATFDRGGDCWRLSGEKTFVSFGETCNAVVVMAWVRGEGERNRLGAFLVDKGIEGFEVSQQIRKMGIRGEDTTSFHFNDCALPPHARLDASFGQIMAVFNHSRPNVAACALGICRAILDETQRLLNTDPMYEVDAAERPACETCLLDLEAEYEAAWLATVEAKWLQDQQQDSRIAASTAKALAGQLARRVSQSCIELVGLQRMNYWLEKWFRDARIFDIYEGPGEIQRLIIARAMLNFGPKELS